MASQPESKGERRRLKRDRDFARNVATVLSDDRAIGEQLADIARLIREAIDAPAIAFSLDDGRTPRRVFDFSDARDRGPWPSELGVSIDFGGRTIGTIALRSRAAGAFGEDDAAMLDTAALLLGARLHDESQQAANVELAKLAETDALTGLANRRAFDESLAREWRRCARSRSAISVAILDIDYFKRYNDAYGHVAGDACLKQVAHAIALTAQRPGDVAARYGGEEFVVLMPECGAEGAQRVAEAICEAVRSLGIAHDGSSLGIVTMSVGVATMLPDANAQPQTLVDRADKLLYRAKGGGRNRAASEGHISVAPEAHARIVTHDNLPLQRTPIIGRERELGEIAAAMHDARLVSIVGTGGIGKTRIALELASRSLSEHADGVWFADLAPIAEAPLVASAVASSIGIELAGGREPVAALATLLKGQALLLVLDNCEHLIGECARLADAILRACPRVRILATSREPLAVEGEGVYRLDTLDEATAIALFEARALQAGARLAPEMREDVRELCRRMDGIALAIELAAARVHAISPAAMLQRFDERFRLLAGGRRTALPRQQTLRALIDWSYDLLAPDQQAFFRRLGVFSGSFTFDAAGRVAAHLGADTIDALDVLSSLVEKSMVVALRAEVFAASVQRYRLLDSLRDYARERLREAGELESAGRAHAGLFRDMSDALIEGIGVGTEESWLATFEPELDNFRTALEWSTANEPALASHIAGNLRSFWQYRGLISEGRERSEAALAALADRDAPEAIPALLAVCAFAGTSKEGNARAIEAGERGLAIAERIGDPWQSAEARWILGIQRFRIGIESERGLQERKEASEYIAAHTNPVRGAIVLLPYAYALATHDAARARALIDEQLTVLRAQGWLRPALAGEANLAELDFAAGEIDAAIERADRVIAWRRARKDPVFLAIALSNVASYLTVAGRYDEAIAPAREAAGIGLAYGVDTLVAYGVQALALAAAAGGEPESAATMLGSVDGFYERLGAARERTEGIVAARAREILAGQLPGERLEACLARGRELPLARALELA